MSKRHEYATLTGLRSTALSQMNAIRVMRSTSNGQVIVYEKGNTAQGYTRKCSKS